MFLDDWNECIRNQVIALPLQAKPWCQAVKFRIMHNAFSTACCVKWCIAWLCSAWQIRNRATYILDLSNWFINVQGQRKQHIKHIQVKSACTDCFPMVNQTMSSKCICNSLVSSLVQLCTRITLYVHVHWRNKHFVMPGSDLMKPYRKLCVVLCRILSW